MKKESLFSVSRSGQEARLSLVSSRLLGVLLPYVWCDDELDELPRDIFYLPGGKANKYVLIYNVSILQMVLTCRILPISGWKEETFAWTGPFHHGLFFFEFDAKRIFHVQSNGSPRDWTAVEGEECKVTTAAIHTVANVHWVTIASQFVFPFALLAFLLL